MSDAPYTMLTDDQVRRLAEHLLPHAFPELANALRAATDDILRNWHEQTLQALPHLDRLTIEEFEDAIAIILNAVAEAMEARDLMAVRSLLDQAPEHGFDRFLQKYDPHDLLTEERILRKVTIIQLDTQMGRPATREEAAALHELLDIMGQSALLSLLRKRAAEAIEAAERAARTYRLESLGTLALGIGHDLANLLLPLRIRLRKLQDANLSSEEREDLQVMDLISNSMQDLSANLRYLAADSEGSEPQREVIDLSEWCPDFQKFLEPILEGRHHIICDVAENLPPASISRAALSQVMFNLIQNAAKALRDQPDGRIVLAALARSDKGVRLIVADNGPGMSPEMRERCFEPFFSASARGADPGTGLGLSLVHTLLTRAGARIEVHSPPPAPPEMPSEIARHLADGIEQGKQRGTAFIIDLPPDQPETSA